LEELKQKVITLEKQLSSFSTLDKILEEVEKAGEKEFQNKSELESKAVSMITMSGTIATLFMGFGSILLRDIPSEDWEILLPASLILLTEVILTTLVIKYSLDAYRLEGKHYFEFFLSRVFGPDSKKNRAVISEIITSGLGSFMHDLINNHMTSIPANLEVNKDKTKKVITSQKLFLCALTMVPIFAFIIIIYKFY
jgi:hypothetical protein